MKKYIPTGYQIISLDVRSRTSGTAFTPETEDEKVLHQFLSGEIKKPILLKIVTKSYQLLGVPCIDTDLKQVILNFGTSAEELIELVSDKLRWTEIEN